jgi:hypothetical protein
MGTFAERAIADYRLLFADQGKQTSVFPLAANKRKFAVFVFPLQQTNGICCFPLTPFSVCSSVSMEVDFWIFRGSQNFFRISFTSVDSLKTWIHGDIDMETWKHGEMETWRHAGMDIETWRHGYMETRIWKHENGDMDI